MQSGWLLDFGLKGLLKCILQSQQVMPAYIALLNMQIEPVNAGDGFDRQP